MKTTVPTRCLRPDCRWVPELSLTDNGGLEISAYCSLACRVFCVAGHALANAEQTTETQRQMQRLSLVNDMLNLREHPSQYDEGLSEADGIRGVLDVG